MTNYERWRLYTKDLCSPDSYIDFSFTYMIAACLQRRVWLGSENRPIYPNQYVILCGDPGLGKGVVIKEVLKFLSYYKKPSRRMSTYKAPEEPANYSRNGKKVSAVSPEALKMQEEEVRKVMDENGMNEEEDTPKKKGEDKPLLIPMGAESTTYEALVSAIAKAYSGIVVRKSDGKYGQYLHSSLAFGLEELSSLLRKKVEDVSQLLIVAYDCGDYKKATKTQGTDTIKSCCLNFLAGTTPSFMQEVFDEKIIADGFASRTWFIFEYANRSSELYDPELTQDQLIAKFELLQHIKKLTELYGQCTYTPDALEYLTEWWRSFPSTPRANSSLRLKGYYARKKLHVQKLAMAIHFGETTDNMVITLEEAQKAMAMLDKIELKMHYALSFKASNPLAGPSQKILDYLREKDKVTFNELFHEFWNDVQKNELEVILAAMVSMGKIKHIVEGTGASVKNWYSINDKDKGGDKPRGKFVRG